MSDLKIERSLSAPPTRVWKALTDPAKLREWFWPPSFGTTAEIDLQSGGQYRVSAPGGPVDDLLEKKWAERTEAPALYTFRQKAELSISSPTTR